MKPRIKTRLSSILVLGAMLATHVAYANRVRLPQAIATDAGRRRDAATQKRRPNIVLIFPDNLGWGEVGAYGSVRGVPTPRIDQIGAEGIRLNNFNVEFSCTVSRAALLTGRYAVRTGAVQNSGI